jgi:hypothetical protein
LAGAAIGNFIAIFFHDSFLGVDSSLPGGIVFGPTPIFAWSFGW